MSTISGTCRPLNWAAIDELEKLLSIPLGPLVINVIELDPYYDLLTFISWDNRCQVAVVMLMVVQVSGKVLTDVRHIEYLFRIITPFTCNRKTMISVIDGDVGTVHQTTDLMGTLGVELGT